ncbi:MAG: hypothetical protein U0414_04245 [Polyangiaceae bacterium]
MDKNEAKAPLTVKLRGRVGLATGIVISLFVAGMVAAIAGRQGAVGALVGLPVLALGLALAVFGALGRLVVGDDGVRLVRAPETRFIPFASVRSAELTQIQILERRPGRNEAVFIPAVRLRLVDGASTDLPMVGVPEETLAEVVSRVSAGIERARAADVKRSLDRGGRSVAAWRASLEQRVRVGDFRTQALTPETLDGMLADPTVSPEDRIGAALALRASGTEGAAEKIRLAASSSASPRLRVALDAAAEDALDDETFEAALEVDRAR